MAMSASATGLTQPLILPGANVNHVSPDGRYAASCYYGQTVVMDLENNKTWNFESDLGVEYSLGREGSSMSNVGIFAGSTTGSDAAYLDIKNGKWTQLRTPNPGNFGAFGISLDASMIVGYIGNYPENIDLNEEDNTSSIPAFWSRKSDGTYGDPTVLPYPEFDFANRRPQHIIAGWVSTDGNTIIGQMVDGFGAQCEPLRWTKKDGKWEYTILGEDLLNPNKVKFPTYYKAPYFDPTDYMTAAELAAYEKAYDEYVMNGYIGTAPEYQDFMTPEEIEAQQKAYDTYMELYMKWDNMFNEWQQAYFDCLDNSPNYKQNQYYFNGTQAIYNATAVYENPDAGPMEYPYIEAAEIVSFDTATGAVSYFTEGTPSASTLSNDGDILAFIYDDNGNKNALIIPAGKTAPVEIAEWLKGINAEYPDWIKENMSHTFVEYNEVLDPVSGEFKFEEVEVERVLTGMPISCGTLNLLSLCVDATWSQPDDEYYAYYSYLLPLNINASIEGITSSNSAMLDLEALRGGIVRVKGDARSLRVYDLQGRMMFESLNPEAETATGVAQGMYLVKAEAADGTETVVKAIF